MLTITTATVNIGGMMCEMSTSVKSGRETRIPLLSQSTSAPWLALCAALHQNNPARSLGLSLEDGSMGALFSPYLYMLNMRTPVSGDYGRGARL